MSLVTSSGFQTTSINPLHTLNEGLCRRGISASEGDSKRDRERGLRGTDEARFAFHRSYFYHFILIHHLRKAITNFLCTSVLGCYYQSLFYFEISHQRHISHLLLSTYILRNHITTPVTPFTPSRFSGVQRTLQITHRIAILFRIAKACKRQAGNFTSRNNTTGRTRNPTATVSRK